MTRTDHTVDSMNNAFIAENRPELVLHPPLVADLKALEPILKQLSDACDALGQSRVPAISQYPLIVGAVMLSCKAAPGDSALISVFKTATSTQMEQVSTT